MSENLTQNITQEITDEKSNIPSWNCVRVSDPNITWDISDEKIDTPSWNCVCVSSNTTGEIEVDDAGQIYINMFY